MDRSPDLDPNREGRHSDVRDFFRRAGALRRKIAARQNVKALRRLTPQQRRRLVGLTGLMGLVLAGFVAGLLQAWQVLPGLPDLLFLSTRVRAPAATPTPPAAVASLLGTQPLGAEAGDPPVPTPTPSAYLAFMPGILYIIPTPTPTVVEVFIQPPPTPNWPDALPGLTASKLGLHVVRNNDNYIMEFVRRVHPRVVKAVDDLGWLVAVKAASSPTVTIGRLSGQDESWPDTKDPVQAADEYIASQLDRYRLNPGVDYWEGWNEYRATTPDYMRWYAQFEAARACKMRDLGFKAAVGGFSVGVPEYDEMELFLPALQAAHDCGGIFTLHEYNSPNLECGVSVGEVEAIPHAPQLSMPVGYHTLRYRFWYEGYLKPRGLGDLPLVISELAIQGPGTACGDDGQQRSGWRSYSDWWVQHGYAAQGPQAYLNTLAWYDAELRKDSYVVGATIFTAGAVADTEWTAFDVHDILVPLAYYSVDQKPDPVEPQPEGYP